METCSLVLTFESVDQILWSDHSNETFSAVLLHGTNRFSIFYKRKFGIFSNFDFQHFSEFKDRTKSFDSANPLTETT